jgi:4-hydroxybenzoate polyprenyltransferase
LEAPVRPSFDRPVSPLLPYLRLMRLPNVFTAIADIAMGFLFVHRIEEVPQQWPVLALLIASSALLYTAGMILNDLWDLEIDRAERPFRPLPSGQISVSVAMRLGFLFLFNGVMLAAAAGYMHQPALSPPWRSGAVAALLALAIVAYDNWLKHTPIGPIGMGLCRLLNVLLGMSAAGIAVPPDEQWLSYHPASWLIAGGLGLYVTGVTWFARSEAGRSSSLQLSLASVAIACGIVLIASFPRWPHPEKGLITAEHIAYLLFAMLSLPMLRRALAAIADPEPANVQAMVKHCILSIIVLDAAVTILTSSPMAGLLVAALLAPSVLLGRYVYST